MNSNSLECMLININNAVRKHTAWRQHGAIGEADNCDRKILGSVSLLQSSACTCGDCELMSKAIRTTNRIGL